MNKFGITLSLIVVVLLVGASFFSYHKKEYVPENIETPLSVLGSYYHEGIDPQTGNFSEYLTLTSNKQVTWVYTHKNGALIKEEYGTWKEVAPHKVEVTIEREGEKALPSPKTSLFERVDPGLLRENPISPVLYVKKEIDISKTIIRPGLGDEMLKNIEITVPETSIRARLSDGSGEWSDGPIRGTVSLVSLLTSFSSKKETYAVAHLVLNTGGSGMFHYIGLFTLSGTVPVHTSSVFIGDRIKILGAHAETQGTSHAIHVDYLERNEETPMSDPPTVEQTAVFSVKDAVFVE